MSLNIIDHGVFTEGYQINYVDFGGGLFIAVGNGDAEGALAISSPDGKNWTRLTGLPRNTDLLTIKYADGLFVTGGRGGAIFKYDGTTWTDISPDGKANDIYAHIDYGGGYWIATNLNLRDYIEVSNDLEEWIERDGFNETIVRGSVFDGSKWIIVGDSVYYFVCEPDVSIVTPVEIDRRREFNDISFNGTIFASAGYDGAALVVSQDGYSYNIVNTTAQGRFLTIIYNNSFLVGGDYGYYGTSYDGIEYEIKETDYVTRFKKFAKNGQVVLGVDSGAWVLFFDDTPPPPPPPPPKPTGKIAVVKYPILVNVEGIFTIKDEDLQTFYYGRNDSGQPIDISYILQDYLNSDAITLDVPQDSIENNVISHTNRKVKAFYVYSPLNFLVFSALVTNDYNDDYVLSYSDNYLTSYSVTEKYHPEDILFIDQNSPSGTGTIDINGTVYNSGNSVETAFKNSQGYRLNVVYSGSLGIANNFFSVTFGNGIFVAVGGNNGFYGVSNGTSQWSTGTFVENIIFLKVIFGNGIFVAFSDNGQYSTTTDGVSWSPLKSTGLTDSIYSACFVNNTYYFISSNGTYGYSADLSNWSTGSTNLRTGVRDLKYFNNMFITVDVNGYISYSSSITTSFTIVRGAQNGLSAISYGNDLYVAIGSFGNYTVSNNLTTWNQGNTGYNNSINDITFNVFFAAVGNESHYFSSSNGTVWDINTLGTTTSFQAIAFGNGLFVTVGNTSTFASFNYSTVPGDVSVKVNGANYPFKFSSGCEPYTLYFVTRLGGRAQCLIESFSDETYNNDFSRYRTGYDRTSPLAFQNRTIKNYVQKTWTLRTGLLTDEQSKRMDDLYTSPKVWLHDHSNDVIYSVVIRDPSVYIRRTRKDHMFYYTITVDQAQDHIRR